MKLEFKKYKKELFTALLSEEFHVLFMNLIKNFSKQGHSKKEIYELFLDFHQEIQVTPETSESEELYDRLSDFMDGFTAWGKSFKILPDEPD